MTHLKRPKGLKGRVYIPGALLMLSLVSHGLILKIPVPQLSQPETPSESPLPQPEDIAVVILPEQEAPAAAVPDLPETLPPSDVRPETVSPAAAIPAPEPAAIPPEPSLPEETAAPTEPEIDPSVPSDDAPVDDATTPSYSDPDPPAPVGPLATYGDEFPHHANAVGGCFGLAECRRVSGEGSYRNVARSLIADLEVNGYGVKLRDDLDDTGRWVYELTVPGSASSPQYLIVFSDIDGSAVYVMSDQVLTLNELQALNAQTSSNHQAG
ncbi:MAG: hypothetical protein F6J95_032850 [Leptolyngbya sp. SIO1E4]|nr:hypothetical protein [Leptolyngbya sp. SIO1E4]